MITMYCQQCREPNEVDEHATVAFDEATLAKHLASHRCAACHTGLTVEQIEVAIAIAQEHWEHDKEYWMAYMMGGYRRGTH